MQNATETPRTQYHLFKERTASIYHRTPLVSLDSNPAFKEYLALTRKVFGHQVGVYTDKPTSEWTDTQKMAHFFYEKCYVPPRVLHSQTHVGSEVTLSDFVNDTFIHGPFEYRNRVRYLLGDVGIGKTAFVNYLITNTFKPHIEKALMWFLRADIEDYSQGSVVDVTAEDFVSRLADHARDVFKKHSFLVEHKEVKPLYDEFVKHMPLAFPPAASERSGFARPVIKTQGTEALTALIRSIYQHTGRRLTVIIDNVDKYIHHRDSNLFDSDDTTGDEAYIEEMIRCLLVFSHDMALGSIGANILFVSRTDTYDILCDLANGTSLQPSIAQPLQRDAYVLKAAALRTVVRSRIPLLEFASGLQTIEGRRKHFAAVTRRISSELLDEQNSVVDSLYKLCNHGYRQLMDYFSRYGWSKHGTDNDPSSMLEQFTHRQPVALISFILGELALYSQFTSKFPNIYLARHLPTATQDPKDVEMNHSYWLKRLICELLAKEGTCATENILRILADNDVGFYSPKLCRLLLGSLSNADCSNTLSVTRSLHPHHKHKLRISAISLSPRGEHCCKSVFDTFVYLQLIVDDFHLYVPREVADIFAIPFSTIKHYGYLVESGREHINHTKEMIRHKARQVLVFLEILRHSLAIEQEIYSKAFARLKEVAPETIPNVSQIRQSILDELVRINASSDNFLDVNKYSSEAQSKTEAIMTQLKLIYGIA